MPQAWTKQSFLANASALLFPIDWPEPFGLVMIDAMACGTPVIVFRRGSVAEVIDHGVTGFIVDDDEQAMQAIKHVPERDRQRVRSGFERRFISRRMAEDYVRHYQLLLEKSPISMGPLAVENDARDNAMARL
jgi:glycosyltransferase involved in cell wall biosynthesis